MSLLADMPLALTVEEAAKVLRIGRSAAYAAARSGDLPTIRVGRSLRVPRHRLEQMLGICPAEEAPA
jgi:excisionase family DNA binding protein